jgi:hypothetical protein
MKLDLAVGLVALLWIIFYAVRWVTLGFSGRSDIV